MTGESKEGKGGGKGVELLDTPLRGWHVEHGAKMVGFAGYSMPLNYRLGMIQEHKQVRSRAGLFDVSHMGQFVLRGKGGDEALERIVGADIQGLRGGKWLYSQILNDRGGIEDDLLIGRDRDSPDDSLWLVVNAGCKGKDKELIMEAIEGRGLSLEELETRGLLALQGKEGYSVAERVLGIGVEVERMGMVGMEFRGSELLISRTGYTGEDGVEISVDSDRIELLAEELLRQEEVELCGLGCRNTLRIEASLCLYGSDIDSNITPVEAKLSWSLGKRRIEEGGFKGYEVILDQLQNGTEKQRVGLVLSGRDIARDGAKILDLENRREVGEVSSGCFSPQFKRGIAMAYVDSNFSEVGSRLLCEIRGSLKDMEVVEMPFIKSLI